MKNKVNKSKNKALEHVKLGGSSPKQWHRKDTFKHQREDRSDSFRQNYPDDRSGI